MSKGNKEEQKWLLGESLNQYDRSLKEELGKVEKRNREQNHKISALINAFDDDYIKKEEENTNISLDYSKEGIVIVDDIKGNTLVNNVKDSNKELVLNGDIDTQGVNVTLEDTVDNGKVDVVLEGNTEINLSKTKDPIMITHKFDDINSNNGKLQTTVDGVTTINDSPGKVDVKEITGDTLINHVSNGSEELTLNGDIDTNGYSNVTLTEGIDGGKVDISLEGNTMVNVCDQEDPIAITKSYTVETGNHIALQGEYDGKCRPYIYGNTLINLALAKGNYSYKNDIVTNNRINLVRNLKAGVTYTLIRTISEFSGGLIQEAINFYDMSFYIDGKQAQDHNCQYRGNGQYVSKFTPTKDVTHMDIIIGMDNIDKDNGIYPTITISDYIILEGDYTNKPIPDYFTGMKSSFEDKLVPENLINYNEVVCNYNEAKDYQPINTKANQIYTVVVNILENTCDKGVWFSAYEFIGQSAINDYYLGDVTEGNIKLASQGQTGIFKLRIGYTQLGSKGTRFVLFSENFTSGNFKATAYVVEGDYTNYDFTNYDSTKGGKYKIDYKVTGKNKLNIELLRNQSNFGIDYTNYGFWYYPLKVEKGKTYNISIGADSLITNGEMTPYLCVTEKKDYNKSSSRAWMNHVTIGFNKTQTIQSVDGYLYIQISNGMEYVNYLLDNIGYIQLEEGTTATDYEPYKESIKTLYLNSPLLEGDTIEQSSNNIIHNHRYGSVVLDGSEDETWYENTQWTNDDCTTRAFYVPQGRLSPKKANGEKNILCDRFIINAKMGIQETESVFGEAGTGAVYIRIKKDKLSTQDLAGFKQYLQQNPITVVYELAQPTQEIISTNDNLLLDSYTNGHLDVDSVVPIDKVKFNGWGTLLKYLYPNQDYIIQFESDNLGKLSYIGMNYKAYYQDEVTKGINRFIITTTEKIQSNFFELNGIGFNASKIVVTPKVDNDFGYFKGMKSVGECEGNKIEILSSKDITPSSFVKYTVNGIEFNFDGKLINENVYVHNISNKALWVHTSINSKYSNGFKIGKNSKKLIELKQGETIYCASVNYSDGWSNSDVEKARNSFIITKKENEINKKEILLNQPLRGLPNGVKDKYVIIDGKWYIERNTVELLLDNSLTDIRISSLDFTNKDIQLFFIRDFMDRIKKNVDNDTLSNLLSDKFNSNAYNTLYRNNIEGISINQEGGIGVSILKSKLSTVDIDGFKQWISNNPTKVICELAQPTYEPIDYNPFEVYTDITHISNNSTIPCNMVIKNSGYNTISLKENTKYTAYVNNKNNVSLTYKLDNNAIAVNSSNKFTFTTPSTLVDKTIRIASKGNKIENLMIIEGTPQNDPIGYFDSLKSSYECEKVTDVNDENFGKYKVDARVKGENFESTQTVYLNSPLLKGDKIIWKDNKLQHYHKMKTIVFDGSDDENWVYWRDNTDNGKLDSSLISFYLSFTNYISANDEILIINDRFIPSNTVWASNTEKIALNGDKIISFQIACLRSRLTTQDVTGFKKYLQQNPITVVYELATPYYEEISEYPLKFSSIANCSLSIISNIQVSNISFNIYEETLPYLYNDKKYYITFNSDISKEIIINLGGSELIYITKVGFNKIEITTPSNSNNMLTFNGQGVNINNVKVTQQNIDSYFEGMKSVGECEELEIVSNNNDNTLSNKQTMTHEPLRGLPNGVKDKYVIIDSKWYIERNCGKYVSTGNENIYTYLATNNNVVSYMTLNDYFNTMGSDIICDKELTTVQGWSGYHKGISAIRANNENRLILSQYDTEQCKTLLKQQTTFIYELQTPTYEPIDYNPLEVYTDITHISNNSTIPCNMVIKNTGYNCILKPNTKYTVVTNTQGSISAKIGSTKVDSTSNTFTIITPSTLTDSVLRLSGKGLTTKDIMLLEGDKTNYIPKYFTGMESAFEQEYDEEKNKYKVNVKVTDGNKENNITFYINEPLRGVGDVKDKVYVKEDKVVVQRNCASAIFDENTNIQSGYVSPGIHSRKMNFIVDKKVYTDGSIETLPKIICPKLITKNLNLWANIDDQGCISVNQEGNIAVRLPNMYGSTPKEVKSNLGINPITVVYQLATPVYEEVKCDLSKLMLENYENSSLILNSNIPPTVDVRYKGEAPIVSATKELSSNVESTTTDINENIIPYMCDMDYRIVELQLKNASTQGLEVNVLGLDSEDVLFNNRKANKIFNPSYEMLKRDILSKRYSTDEYKYRLERYLLANKISNEEYNELEELINGR